jgi:ribosomal protein S25
MPRKKKTSTKKSPAGGKSRKTKKGMSKSPAKKDSEVLSGELQQLSLSTDKMVEELGKIKAITPFSIASTFDLKVGKAKKILRSLEEQGTIRCVGGNSRIRIYALTSS